MTRRSVKKMKHFFILLSLPVFLSLLSCQKQRSSNEVAPQPLTKDQLVGTWFMEVRGGFDPPLDITLSLENSGDFKHSAILADDESETELDPFTFSGHWHYSKVDDSMDTITLNTNKHNETIIFAVEFSGDTMAVSMPNNENESIYDFNKFHRVLQLTDSS